MPYHPKLLKLTPHMPSCQDGKAALNCLGSWSRSTVWMLILCLSASLCVGSESMYTRASVSALPLARHVSNVW